MTTVTTETAVCQHHYIIAPPAGRTSSGVCKRCGAERDFNNTLDIEGLRIPLDQRIGMALSDLKAQGYDISRREIVLL